MIVLSSPKLQSAVISTISTKQVQSVVCYKAAMFRVLGLLLGLLHLSFHSRRDLLLENLALRQQLVAFQRRNPKPRLRGIDRLFWVIARRLWSKWKQALMYVTPQTVARWHRAGFRLYWSWLSRHRKVFGRKPISKQVRALIFQMVWPRTTPGALRTFTANC